MKLKLNMAVFGAVRVIFGQVVKRFTLTLACFSILLFSLGASKADTTFNIDASGCTDISCTTTKTVTGTVTIDVTIGSITASDINVEGISATFTTVCDLFCIALGSNQYEAWFYNSSDYLEIIISTPLQATGSLVDYAGGAILHGYVNNKSYLQNITGSISPVPVPGALPLFATGLGLLGLLGWRRKRKKAAAMAAA